MVVRKCFSFVSKEEFRGASSSFCRVVIIVSLMIIYRLGTWYTGKAQKTSVWALWFRVSLLLTKPSPARSCYFSVHLEAFLSRRCGAGQISVRDWERRVTKGRDGIGIMRGRET